MQFHVMTLFPEMIEQGFLTSITGKAVEKGLLSMEAINIRDYTLDKHKKVDDYPYGGGAGMLMQAQPVYDCYESIANKIGKKPRVIYVTPQGQVFNQTLAKEFAKEEDLVFLCGHYEGIDERVLEEIVTDYVSIGDYVLTGGELASLVMMDAISRLVKGVLNNDESAETESFTDDLLEHPQYSRPVEWHGKKVPEVLLSGHHANVEKWRLEQSILRTKERRPDLYEKYRERHPKEPEKKKRKRKSPMKRVDLFDLHSHTLASGHAYSTIAEMAKSAKEKGLLFLGITEHAPKMPGSCKQFYFNNLKVVDREHYDCPLLLGVELNINGKEGNLDLPEEVLKEMDLCIASMHPPIYEPADEEQNTDAMLQAMSSEYVSIIGHPDDGRIPLNYERFVKGAKEHHVILEINNASQKPNSFRLNTVENATKMLSYCKEYGVPVILNSDAHVDTDVAFHDYAWKLIEKTDFPRELVVNSNPRLLLEYLRPEVAKRVEGYLEAIEKH